MFFAPFTRHRLTRSLALLPLLAAAACERAAPRAIDSTASRADSAVVVLDDFGAPVPVDARDASRVVSLNPAATEAIYAMGESARLVGRSRWDEFPHEATKLPSLGDGIRPNIEAVLAARPTLVVLYATPDNRAAADAFARAGVRTIALRVDRLEHFARMMDVLGKALGAEQQSRVVRDSVFATLDRVKMFVKRHVPDSARPTVVWPVWVTPPMVIGAGSYMNQLMEIAGAVNVFADQEGPSPAVSVEEIVKRGPQRVITSEATRPKLQESTAWGGVPAVKNGAFVIDDPKLIGRPSVTLGMAVSHLARQLHPALADSLR